MHLRPGERIGDWIVDDVLGEGGMGAVYRAHSTLTERLEAAIKVMKPALGPEFRARFVREAEALSALRHPAIVRVMGFSEDPKRELLYLVMELAYGETLKARMSRGPMPLPEALQVFVPLASALDHAHEEGIFHRDLKPANVVLCEDGPRLVDFGIAAAPAGQTLTDGTGQLGTLAYLPPEVFRGLVAEPQAIDVYGFGLLLHEALSGQRVFPVDSRLTPAAAAAAVGVRKLQQPAVDPGEPHPARLRELVLQSTDADPAVRPTMREIRQGLESLVERRGRGAVKGTAGTTGPVRITTPVAERTMRVPDPPKPTIGDPRTATPVRFHTAPPRAVVRRVPGWVPMLAAAGGLAILLAFLGALLWRGGADAAGSPAPRAARTPPPAAAAATGATLDLPATTQGLSSATPTPPVVFAPSVPPGEPPVGERGQPAVGQPGPPQSWIIVSPDPRAGRATPAADAADPAPEEPPVTAVDPAPPTRMGTPPATARPSPPTTPSPPPSPSPQVQRVIVRPSVGPAFPPTPALPETEPPVPEPTPTPRA